MSDLWNFLIHSNIFNFLIVFYLIILLFKKVDINKITEKLKDDIKNYVQESEKEKSIAEEKLNNINKKISKLPEEKAKIEESTNNSVKNIGEKIHSEIEEKKKDISNNAERIFNLETKKFKQKLTSILSEKSIEISMKNAVNQLNENKDLHNKYIDNAISELDRIVL